MQSVSPPLQRDLRVSAIGKDVREEHNLLSTFSLATACAIIAGKKQNFLKKKKKESLEAGTSPKESQFRCLSVKVYYLLAMTTLCEV